MTGNATTMRETLVQYALEEVDNLLTRTETVSATLEARAAALEAAGAKYKDGLAAVTTSAKNDLKGFSGHASAKTVEEQRVALEEAARLAFHNEAAERFKAIEARFGAAAPNGDKGGVTRRFIIAACAASAIASAISTTLIVYFLK